MADRHTVQNGTVFQNLSLHSVAMRIRDLAPEMFLSVPCPTCRVASGKRCLLHSGAPRSQAHVDRKLTAAEAIEMKRIPRGPDIDKSPSHQQSEVRGGKPCYRQ